jgi:hypothetical protein
MQSPHCQSGERTHEARCGRIDCEINIGGDAAVLIQDRYIESVTPLGMPPLRELMAKVREKSIPIFV